MISPILKLENVWKIYPLGKTQVEALKGINLEIMPGEFLCFMGPSGSGKSTLLNLIGCLDFPTKGKIFLKGKDISQLSENELALLRGKTIGFVFQEFNLFPNFTALENVSLPMIFQGVPKKERIKRARELLEAVQLKDKISRKILELSGGERQRVAIARALANDPEILIADEPTGNLDSLTGKKIMEILTQFHQRERKTIVLVTHDPQIAGYAQKIIYIRDGKLKTEN